MLYASRKAPTRITTELVDWIQNSFPPEPPEPHMQINEIMYEAGKQYVIQWLRNQQTSNAVEAFDNRSMT